MTAPPLTTNGKAPAQFAANAARVEPLLAAASASLQAKLPGATFVLLSLKDHARVSALFTDSYLAAEPLTLALLGASENPSSRDALVSFLRTHHAWAATQLLHNGPCVGVRNSAGELLGCVLTEDYACLADAAPLSPPPAPTNAQEFGAVNALIAPIKRRFKDEWTAGKVPTLWVANLSVSPAAQGLGLGTELVKSALKIADAHGFKWAMGEATGFSQECFAKAGMQEIASVEYSTFEHDGVKVFTDVAKGWKSKRFPVAGVRLMVNRDISTEHM
ncbi:hypothetical protein HDU89_006509 [Geranomyces variabilis]|nr:hypothetical protein HDU89_006509 [Geranomyces variabilis]